jgi:hypothetical protein
MNIVNKNYELLQCAEVSGLGVFKHMVKHMGIRFGNVKEEAVPRCIL